MKKDIHIPVPAESETTRVIGYLRLINLSELQVDKISYPNLTLSLKDNTVFIERAFDKPYSAKEVENWAIQVVHDFANLLAFSNGSPILIERVSWTLTDNQSGISVELQRVFKESRINRKGKIPISSEEMGRCFSWIGSSRALAFAIYEYNVALTETYSVNQLVHLYKILELLEEMYGGEKELISFLVGAGITKAQYKKVKRIMNEPKRFIRHSPSPEEPIVGLSPTDLDASWELTEKVLLECMREEETQWILE